MEKFDVKDISSLPPDKLYICLGKRSIVSVNKRDEFIKSLDYYKILLKHKVEFNNLLQDKFNPTLIDLCEIINEWFSLSFYFSDIVPSISFDGTILDTTSGTLDTDKYFISPITHIWGGEYLFDIEKGLILIEKMKDTSEYLIELANWLISFSGEKATLKEITKFSVDLETLDKSRIYQFIPSNRKILINIFVDDELIKTVVIGRDIDKVLFLLT